MLNATGYFFLTIKNFQPFYKGNSFLKQFHVHIDFSRAQLHFSVDCVVELFKQSKFESNLDRNSAIPMALDGFGQELYCSHGT